MATTVAVLTVKVAADLASFRAGLKQLNQDLIDFDKGAKTTVKKVNTYFSTIKPRVNTYQANADLRSFQFYADNTAKQIQKSLQIVPSINTKGLKSSVSRYANSGSVFNTPNVIKTAITYFSAKEIMDYADAWTAAGNKIAAAAQISGRSARSLEDVNKIATETRTDLAGTVDLYARLLRSTKDVATSELEVAQATATVNKAFKTGGADVQEQRAGLIQLSQALGSGMLQGDELRSIRENAPVLAQAIADYFGTTIAGLKKLGSEGQLTSDKVFKAILAAQKKIDAAYAATNQTIAESFTLVSNALTQYIGNANEATSVGGRLVAGLKSLAENFDSVANTTLKLAAIIASALIGRAIGNMLITLRLASGELLKFAAAMKTFISGASLATAFGGTAAAAGPLGALIGTVLVGALVAFGTSSEEATEEAKRFKAGLDKISQASEQAKNDINNLTEAKKRQKEEDEKLNKTLEEGKKQESRLNEEMLTVVDQYIYKLSELKNSRKQMGLNPPFTEDEFRIIEMLSQGLRENKLNASQVDQALTRLVSHNSNFENLKATIESIADEWRNVSQTIEGITIQIKGMSPELSSHFADIQSSNKNRLNDYAKQDFFNAQFDIADNSKFESLVEKEIKRLQDALKNDPNAPKNISDAELRANAERNVTASLNAKALDAAIEEYVNNVVGAESSGRADAKNKLSSATGVGQFIESTWLNLFNEMFPEEAKSKTRAEILDLRNNIEYSKILIAQYGKENAEYLKKHGIDQVSKAMLHLAHFLGPSDALKVLQAPSGTPISSLLSEKVINANKSILGGNATNDTVIGYAEKRQGMNTPRAQMFGGIEAQTAALIADEKDIQLKTQLLALQTKYTQEASQYKQGSQEYINTMSEMAQKVAELEKAHELLNNEQSKAAGLTEDVISVNDLLAGNFSKLSPVLQDLAQKYREAAEAAGLLAKKQEEVPATIAKVAEETERIKAAEKDVFKGFIQDLIQGKSLGEAFANVLQKIADKLLDKAFDILFGESGSSSTGAIGGLFSGLFKLLGFASGGYTGDGGKYEPAGVVHKGEYVLNQNATRKLGVGNLDRLNKGMGYANGGYVTGISNASMGSAGISGGGAKSQLQIHLVTDNAAIAGIADARIKNASPAIVAASVKINQTQTRDNFGQYVTNYNARNA